MSGLEERDAAAGAVATKPRVSLEQIKQLIDREEFHIFDDVLTVCVLTLKNGYKVLGQSASADPDNFNAELGEKIARDKAISEIWPLAGFMLRDSLHRGDHPPVMRCKVQLADKTANVDLIHGPDAPGRTEVRTNDQGREYTWTDPTDPLNYRFDGARLSFTAVWESPAPDDPDRANAARENRIFTDATPSIEFRATVRNQAVLDRLAAGMKST